MTSSSSRYTELGDLEFEEQRIPNFVVLKDGRPVFQQAGVVPAAEMTKWLESAGAR